VPGTDKVVVDVRLPAHGERRPGEEVRASSAMWGLYKQRLVPGAGSRGRQGGII
jgi:hypothetical protein